MAETDEPDLAYLAFLKRTARRKRRGGGEVVTMMRKENQGNWGLEVVLKKRKELMRTRPIMSDEITELDSWLVTQSLSIKDLIQIWSRCQYCWLVYYDDADPALKHLMLLHLRDVYHEFCKLPPKMQKRLWPMWESWAEELRQEEEQEAKFEEAMRHA
jgi:hypothetical protein